MSGSIELWGYISVSCFVLAAVFLVIAIVMFFSFDIRKVRKELSGKHVESYMEEYRRKKEENKRVGIYDPSGKLISNVGSSNVSKGSFNPKMQTPSGKMAGGSGINQPMGDIMAKSRAAASVKTENATQVLTNKNNKYNDFVIIKDFVFSETMEYIG